MMIFAGGRLTNFKNLKEHDTYDSNGVRLFRIRGTNEEDIRAVQMPELSSSLDSDDIFALETPAGNYLWFGKVKNFLTLMALNSPGRACLVSIGTSKKKFI